MLGIFTTEEELVKKQFELNYSSEIELINNLLKVYESFILATSNKIKDNEYPNWTIMLLLSQNPSLIESAFKLLSVGYLRASEIILRVCAEAIILSAYFKEFPEAEVEYRAVHHSIFFRNHRIEKMLKKVEKGKIFNSKNKKIQFNKIIFNNIYEEASKFIHNNSQLIEQLSNNQANPSGNQFILGPQVYSGEIIKNALRRIISVTLFSVVIFSISLLIIPDDSELNIIKQAGKYLEK